MLIRLPPHIFVAKKWVKEQWGASGIYIGTSSYVEKRESRLGFVC